MGAPMPPVQFFLSYSREQIMARYEVKTLFGIKENEHFGVWDNFNECFVTNKTQDLKLSYYWRDNAEEKATELEAEHNASVRKRTIGKVDLCLLQTLNYAYQKSGILITFDNGQYCDIRANPQVHFDNLQAVIKYVNAKVDPSDKRYYHG